MRWEPDNGHLPRGFRGATGKLSEIKLVLVLAEPGDPYPKEGYGPTGAPGDQLRGVYTASCRHLEEPADQFARNVRLILDMAWPDLPYESQMRKTWMTESVLCSAAVEGGSVPKQVETECAQRYLLGQLALLPNARVVALGKKAQGRLARAGVEFVPAWAASPPGCNRREAPESWKRAVAEL